jgi:ATP-dependent DNA ligase
LSTVCDAQHSISNPRKRRKTVRATSGKGLDIVYRQACQLGCEGIVSKRLGSMYRSGRSKRWVKVKESGSAGGAARSRGRLALGQAHVVPKIKELR